jgi:hypothetical protein
MFKQSLLKVLAKVSIGICILGAVISFLISFMAGGTKEAIYPLLSWALLTYASYNAMQLTQLDIYEEDLVKIGMSIYILFAIFILFLIMGLSLSPFVAVIMAGRLAWQKKTIENWTKDNE